jgi:hypothetical protein
MVLSSMTFSCKNEENWQCAHVHIKFNFSIDWCPPCVFPIQRTVTIEADHITTNSCQQVSKLCQRGNRMLSLKKASPAYCIWSQPRNWTHEVFKRKKLALTALKLSGWNSELWLLVCDEGTLFSRATARHCWLWIMFYWRRREETVCGPNLLTFYLLSFIMGLLVLTG